WRIPGEIWPGLIAGLLSGLVGALFFAVAHAVLILPIWSRMGSALSSGGARRAAAAE
ncbi:MAG: hypothetical protein H7Z74_01610, partial [Anaerolineae bacterium]|nr:hypothetical protein [Gemmatimonadaceae bacterium]